MPQSEKIGELAKAIAKAQAEMKPVKRENENPFFKSKYADLASVWEAIKPFQANGIAVTQMPFDAGEGMIGITTQLTHESGEWMNGSLALPLSKADAQGVGSAITYARRYALGCLTGVVTEEDDDGNLAVQMPVRESPVQRYQKNKQAIAKAFSDIRQDIRNVVEQDGARGTGTDVIAPGHEVSGNQQSRDAAPPNLAAVPDTTWDEFQIYVGDDPDRMKIGTSVKKKMSISLLSAVQPKDRKGIILSIQDEARRQGVPFTEWVKE